MSELRGLTSTTALCLRFIILTWTRSSESRGARWSEIDDRTQLWSIPAIRMKASKAHDIPLNQEALEILGAMIKRRTKSDLVFPGASDGVLSDVGLNKVLHSLPTIARLDSEGAARSEHSANPRKRVRGATVHGMRSSARSWAAAQIDFAPFVAELALAHVNKDRVEAAYQRDRVLDKRTALLKAWGDYCSSGNLVPFERRIVC